MTITWLTVFVDMPADRFDAGTDFWTAVTGSTRSPLRGEHHEFATLLPATGDPHVRVQRIMEGEPGVHLDLHTDDIGGTVDLAQRLGAHIVAADDDEPGLTVMSSPGGMTFCIVSDGGEQRPPDPLPTPAPNRLNQICIDVPSTRFDTELAFWSGLTGWAAEPGRLSEFVFLSRPTNIPLRVLLQRLGDETGTVHAHIDIGCGAEVATIADEHERLGAETIGPFTYWTTMADPSGQRYCLTSRDPAAGSTSG